MRAARAWQVVGWVLATGMVAAPALGAEGGDGPGLPQFDPRNFPGQIFWLLVSFALLYVLMARKALPRIAEVLEERQDRIDHDLDQADQTRKRAEAVWQSYERALADAHERANAELARARNEIAERQAERERAFEAEMAQRLREAEQRISKAQQDALKEVRSIAVDIVQDASYRVAGVRVSEETARKAVERSVEG